MRYVIIGNSAAAVGAVEGIRQRDKESPITLIAAEPHHTYARPLISYYLAGKVDLAKMAYRPGDFYQAHGVETHLGEKAKSINTLNRNVVLENGENISYDTLLVATGSKPVAPAIPGINKENVFSFHTLDDTRKLQCYLRKGMKGVVLGAGLTALKAAEALADLGIKTTLVVRSRILRNFLDSGAGEILAAHLQEKGLDLVTGCEPAEIPGSTVAESVMLKDGRLLPCDFVISAAGVVPNTDVVMGSGIETDHGILVDSSMRTGAVGVYAAGDVAQGYDLLLGCRRVIPLLPVAYAQGEVAGKNMSGDTISYLGMAMNAVSFFGLPVMSVGLIHDENNADFDLQIDAKKRLYRKLFFRNNHLVGFVLMNEVNRAGILTWLIRERIDVSQFRESLKMGTFNYAHLPEKIRKEKLAAV